MGESMKPLVTLLAYFAFSACGSPTAGPLQGTVYFRMDAVSCRYAGPKNVTFYVANEEVGTESLVADVTSSGYLTLVSDSYPEPGGNPVVRARVANYTASGGALWTTSTNIRVRANESVTQAFGC